MFHDAIFTYVTAASYIMNSTIINNNNEKAGGLISAV